MATMQHLQDLELKMDTQIRELGQEVTGSIREYKDLMNKNVPEMINEGIQKKLEEKFMEMEQKIEGMKFPESKEKKTFWFNKTRKLDVKWIAAVTADDPSKSFRQWRMKAENYLFTGNDDIEPLMDWALKQKDKIQIKEFRGKEDFTRLHPLAEEIDKILYEELITMLDGKAAQVYLEMNSSKSGIEAWRALNAGNDPKTYQQSEVYLQMKDNICKTRCKTSKSCSTRHRWRSTSPTYKISTALLSMQGTLRASLTPMFMSSFCFGCTEKGSTKIKFRTSCRRRSRCL